MVFQDICAELDVPKYSIIININILANIRNVRSTIDCERLPIPKIVLKKSFSLE